MPLKAPPPLPYTHTATPRHIHPAACPLLPPPLQVVDEVMGAQANLSTPEDEVLSLVQQVADEHGLESQLAMSSAPANKAAAGAASKEDDITARLAELRGR